MNEQNTIEKNAEFPELAHSAFADLKSMGWQVARLENGLTVFHPNYGGLGLLDNEPKDSPAAILRGLVDDILKTRNKTTIASSG